MTSTSDESDAVGEADKDPEGKADAAARKRVIEFVGNEGYPLELKVGRILQACNWSVRHQAFYTDPTSGKVRSTDVLASWQTFGDNSKAFKVSLAIECKHSEPPWVVFRGHEAAPSAQKAGLDSIVCLGAGRRYVMRGRDLSGHPDLRLDQGHFGARQVKGAGQGGKDNRDYAYEAISQALSAATAFAQAADGNLINRMPRVVEAVIPVVVIDAQLFEFFLDAAGGQYTTPLPIAWVRSSPPEAPDQSQLVGIVKRQNLAEFVNLLSGTFDLRYGNPDDLGNFLATLGRTENLAR